LPSLLLRLLYNIMDTNNFSSSVSFELASLVEVQVPVPGMLLERDVATRQCWIH
jgi:hypothetical protein